MNRKRPPSATHGILSFRAAVPKAGEESAVVCEKKNGKPFASRIAALALGLTLICIPVRSQTGLTDAWTDKAYAAALDDFFPIRGGDGDFIAVRAHQNGAHEVPEFSFVLEDTQDPHAIHAVLRGAQGPSLYRQLATFHEKEPAKSYADLKSQLKVTEWDLSASQCPAIAAQQKAFENITFVRPHDDDPVPEHPIMYEVNESIGGADSQVIEFVESRAIPRWANETRKALDACAVSLKPE